MCLAQGPQRSDASEAPIPSLSVSSQALYHWATALPIVDCQEKKFLLCFIAEGMPGRLLTVNDSILSIQLPFQLEMSIHFSLN